APEGFLYFTTWDTEGSQTGRCAPRGGPSGTTAGGVVPGHRRQVGVLADSGAGTAFPVTHGGRTLGRRNAAPVHSTQARPVPPDTIPELQVPAFYQAPSPAAIGRLGPLSLKNPVCPCLNSPAAALSGS